MSGNPKIELSDGRHSQSARVQKYFLGETLAILLCPSSNGKTFAVTIDLEDLPRVLESGPWSVSNFDSANGGVKLYAHSTRRHAEGTRYLHRFITSAPSDRTLQVDHRFGRSLDNRKSELRIITRSLNQRNKLHSGPPNRFGMRGVTLTRSGRFSARVWIDHKAKVLGTFDTPERAGQEVKEFLIEQGALVPAGAQ